MNFDPDRFNINENYEKEWIKKKYNKEKMKLKYEIRKRNNGNLSPPPLIIENEIFVQVNN
jgi:hypothetical protein